MMIIKIICVGKLKEKFWVDACAEYAKRLKGFCQFSMTEVEEERMGEDVSPGSIRITLEKEGRRILSAVPKGAKMISMCIEGQQRTSEEMAATLEEMAVNGFGTAVFVIGGSWGLSEEVKKASHIRLSMSKMTFPHQLARVMLCEQIYRAFQISSGGKYHK